MTSRRLIRIKVLQLLYAYIKREDVSLAEIERDLLQSITKSTDLYYHVLMLLTEIQRKAFLKIDSAKNKRFASDEELHPNTRFIDNPLLTKLSANKKFQSYTKSHLVSWADGMDVINYFYTAILEYPAYQKYMTKEKVTFEDHRRIVLDIYVDIITQNELFFQTLEEKSIFWNDDFELVLGIVYKTLKNIKEDAGEDDNIFFPVYSDEDDTDFAKTLLRKTILEKEDYIKIIDKFTYNWEIERISDMDKLIMAAAIGELKHFPSIPVKVTLDEYIEISKSYSSAKSGAFINGVLDKAVSLLKDSNEIVKTGRGLIEE